MEHNMTDSQAIQQEFDFSIVSAKLTIEAMRDSGYKDTDHALAELLDNSIEAGADLVEVIAVRNAARPQPVVCTSSSQRNRGGRQWRGYG